MRSLALSREANQSAEGVRDTARRYGKLAGCFKCGLQVSLCLIYHAAP